MNPPIGLRLLVRVHHIQVDCLFKLGGYRWGGFHFLPHVVFPGLLIMRLASRPLLAWPKRCPSEPLGTLKVPNTAALLQKGGRCE
ncbi:UNVERIFIED_CONTAM: hypothetical protein Slati_3124600 [Sesamum latifolium]|uniref:Uncharacterized protein n=1 Tax=Sesamum latifolium TaxID=2727402 RepID=A0AAW2UVH8_9LAMI